MQLNKRRGGLAAMATAIALASSPIIAQAQNLEGAGSTFVAPIFLKQFAKYKEKNGTTINYQPIGSGAGITALKNHTVDFAASDAPLTPSEAAGMPGPVAQFPVVGGCVVLTYNLSGVGSGLRFTPEVLAGIFLGQIKNWDDPKIKAANPGRNLPSQTIQPVHRTDGSGTTFIFTNYLKRANGEWASGPGAGKSVNWPVGLGGKGSSGVSAVVRRTPGAIAYVELAYAIDNKLPYGSVKNRAGNFVTPGIESGSAAIARSAKALEKDLTTQIQDGPGVNSYPITGFTYVILYKSGGPKVAEVTKLFSWFLQPDQQEEVKTLNYAPLPKPIATLSLAALKSVKGAVVQ